MFVVITLQRTGYAISSGLINKSKNRWEVPSLATYYISIFHLPEMQIINSY